MDAARGLKTLVIAVAATHADERNRILLAGFADDLQKPVQPAALVSAIVRTLHQN